MAIFGSSLRNNQIKNIHQNTPFLKIFSKVHTPEPLCHTIYTLLKIICTLLLNPLMYMYIYTKLFFIPTFIKMHHL